MGVRLPLTTVLDRDDASDVGANSVAGMVTYPFFIPQDTDNVVLKFTASTVGGAVSAVLQTTDDGGTTWYDLGRTSIISNSAGNQNAQFLSFPSHDRWFPIVEAAGAPIPAVITEAL